MTWLLLTALAGASIDGPASFPVYRIGEYRVKDKPPKAIVIWGASPRATVDVKKIEGVVFVTSPPGEFEINCTLYDLDTNKQEDLSRIVTVTNGVVPPAPPVPVPPVPVPPVPTPPTPPAPPTPPSPPPQGKYGLGPLLYAEAMKLPPAAKAKAAPLKEQVENLRAMLVAGSKVNRAEIDTAFAVGAGDQVNLWFPAKQAVVAKITTLNLSKQLKTQADLLVALDEMIGALAAVR